ncbi:MAG: D-alanyl-D-alanine carboxypeptidase [Alphaproteobacteria bacterium]|nr:D-alanyl-D-alanine carboxypeptidase [Alphaproteobacteria bacterium]
MRIYIFAICCLFVLNPAFAEYKTAAKSAFLVDAVSGAVIADKAGDELMPPSSMVKMMTLAVTFDAIREGRIKLTDSLTVSANADYKNPTWATASKICLTRGQQITVTDAILGTIVMSGGDAAVVLAEKLAGGEREFVTQMQHRAREIGMRQSTFGNVSGLPHPDNLMTSRELAVLADYLINTHADLYHFFGTRRFEFGGYKDEWCKEWGRTKTMNYNKLLFIMPGADGLKTGSTRDGGYGMTASAKRGERRLIAVINGFKAKNHDQLAAETKKLLEYGFNTTTTRVFYKSGDEITRVPLWYGRQIDVAATVARPFAITLAKGTDTAGLRLVARYDEPVAAPVSRGEKIGEIIAELDGRIISRAPLVAKDKVGRTHFIGRIVQNIKIIFGVK